MYKTKDFYGIWRVTFPVGGLYSAYCETKKLAKEIAHLQTDQADFSGFEEKPSIIKLHMYVDDGQDEKDKKKYVKHIKEIYNSYSDFTDSNNPPKTLQKAVCDDEEIAKEYIEDLILPSIEKILVDSKKQVLPQVHFSFYDSPPKCDFRCGVYDKYGYISNDLLEIDKTLFNCSRSILGMIKKLAPEYGLVATSKEVYNSFILIITVDLNS